MRTTIEGQLEHAASVLERARSAMAAVLDGGGMRAAYIAQLEMMSAGLGKHEPVSAADEPELCGSAVATAVPAVHVDLQTGRVVVNAGGVTSEFVIRKGKIERSD